MIDKEAALLGALMGVAGTILSLYVVGYVDEQREARSNAADSEGTPLRLADQAGDNNAGGPESHVSPHVVPGLYSLEPVTLERVPLRSPSKSSVKRSVVKQSYDAQKPVSILKKKAKSPGSVIKSSQLDRKGDSTALRFAFDSETPPPVTKILGSFAPASGGDGPGHREAQAVAKAQPKKKEGSPLSYVDLIPANFERTLAARRKRIGANIEGSGA